MLQALRHDHEPAEQDPRQAPTGAPARYCDTAGIYTKLFGIVVCPLESCIAIFHWSRKWVFWGQPVVYRNSRTTNSFYNVLHRNIVLLKAAQDIPTAMNPEQDRQYSSTRPGAIYANRNLWSTLRSGYQSVFFGYIRRIRRVCHHHLQHLSCSLTGRW